MEAPAPQSPTAPFDTELTPVATPQRIEALDVVRGFALLGIFLMNVEFFNRVFASFNDGMPRDLGGIDWLASWFVAYFVLGKFWTIFSLLFGMGFAVMLVRAERAGRDFKRVYLRRIGALAVFGALHYIFVWEGDILFSYAVGALGLLLVLYAQFKWLWLACAVIVALGAIADLEPLFAVAGGVAVVALVGLYLRSERRLLIAGQPLPVFSAVLLAMGLLMSIAASVFWLLPDGPIEPRWPLSVFGPLIVVAGLLSWRYHQPAEQRSVRLAVALYVFGSVAMILGGMVRHFAPDPAAAPPAVAASASTIGAAVPGSSPVAPRTGAAASKTKKTRAERAAEIRAERAKDLAENKAERADELKVFTRGTYGDSVDWRARRFLKKAASDGAFAVVLIAMFLLGVWFVRSGVMENTGAHLAFFRKLALLALPLGIGIGVLSGFIAMSHTPGDRHDGWVIARGLQMLGNLPACLGYVGLVVLMLHSRSALSHIRVLAPAGRMALTNYLAQSVICVIVFYGFALGHWGLSRSAQVLFVLVVFALQVAFSHWWLARFRYGPMEWLWRGFTYRQVPPWRADDSRAQAPIVA